MWNNIKIYYRWFRKVMKMNIAFGWFWPLLKFFLFEWRFADRPWNVVILLGFQVPVPYFDLIFWICDTFRCEITWTIISGSLLVFAFFREKHCVLFSVLRILPEWRWFLRYTATKACSCRSLSHVCWSVAITLFIKCSSTTMFRKLFLRLTSATDSYRAVT